MSKIMPKDEIQERYRWMGPILDKVLTIKQMVKICPFSERTLKYWLARYRATGLAGLRSKSRQPKNSPRRTSQKIRDKIVTLKKETRLGAKKISWLLKDQGINIHERTVGKILKQQGLVRKYRQYNKVHPKWKPASIVVPGKMIEIDIKYGLRLAKYCWFYQFTAIDKASRWRHLQGYDSAGNSNAISFLKDLIKKAPFQIEAIKTDNDAVFTNKYTGYELSKDPTKPKLHAFDILCHQLGIMHYLIDPGRPEQNGCVERSHRTDKEIFYKHFLKPKLVSLEEYQYYLKLWNMWYNDLKHCALNGLSPNQYLKQKPWMQKVQNVWC